MTSYFHKKGLSAKVVEYISGEHDWLLTEKMNGDYCLPNIILDHWKFSGFVDLDSSGVGDRHIDLFWGVWTLCFNLKTDKYCARFLDAYRRDKTDEDMMRLISAVEVFG